MILSVAVTKFYPELDPNFSGEVDASTASTAPEEDRQDSKTPALKAFGRDLTELAKSGELDPVIGRQKKFNAWFRFYVVEPRTIQF